MEKFRTQYFKDENIKKFLMWGVENDYLYFDELECIGDDINTSECVIDKLINRYTQENKSYEKDSNYFRDNN